MIVLACSALCWFLWGGCPAWTATYYVAAQQPGADDGNTGLAPEAQGNDGPWRTLAHAMAEARAGDTILVRAGVYHEADLRFAVSGREGAPITLAAYAAENPVLDGQGLSGSGVLLEPGQGWYVLDGLTVVNMEGSGLATDDAVTEPFHGISVQRCTFEDNGYCGLELCAVDGFLIQDSVMRGNGYYGLNISASKDGGVSSANGEVRHCLFAGHTGEEGHGMAVNQGHDILVVGCRAEHNRIHGFDVSDWPKEGEVSHHVTFEDNFSTDNGVAGFCVNSDAHHVSYVRNVAFRNGAAWAGHGSSSGFLGYEGCWEVAWLNNVAADNSDRGFAVDDPAGYYVTPGNHRLTFVNNISLGNGNPDWDECIGLSVCPGPWDLTVTHNNWAGCGKGEALVAQVEGRSHDQDAVEQGGLGQDNLCVDPDFVDEEAGDFQLQPDSAMIDAGKDVGLPFTGAAPDLGAFER